MAHGYLTKVPVPAILPFIEAFCPEGGTVVDPFAGSGMTGVAAAMMGRRARLFDISVLGQHIGSNYVNLVDADQLRKVASEVVAAAETPLGGSYSVACEHCGQVARLVKAVWSIEVACGGCTAPVNYYEALEAAAWSKPNMICPQCSEAVSARLPHVGERAVLDHIVCGCTPKQREQPPSPLPMGHLNEVLAEAPNVEITPDRQMYQAQSLGKSGRTTIASFYSARNLAVLTELRRQIGLVPDERLRSKLLFAFTASLTRASKRYQWSRQRPLNAANANYYVAPVFYEWNVYDLFLRKVEAAIRSDDFVRRPVLNRGDHDGEWPNVRYEVLSAEALPLPDASVDYVFTDPPFGSNLFYADMALFQEAWLDGFTDVTREAVVRRGGDRRASTERYARILTQALRECRRVLRPGGRVSMVFGNSSGAVWSLVQQAIREAELTIEPDELVVLNKGQRSVKGLASGFEHVATLDLILTMRASRQQADVALQPFPASLVRSIVQRTLHLGGQSPSHLYLELLRTGFREGFDLSNLDLKAVTADLLADGWALDSRTGHLLRTAA
ncbi:MAG TPA: DNA methyltransferase [Acidimicrobiales bacterium]|nr:DNA methyltransferase [Acidimicrobiales bacterium]